MYCITNTRVLRCVSYLFSGWPVPRSDHGLPSYSPAFFSQTLLWSLQTTEHGALTGWPGGKGHMIAHILGNTLVHRIADGYRVYLQCSGFVWQLCYRHFQATHIPTISNNSSSFAYSHDTSVPLLISPWQHTHRQSHYKVEPVADV